MIVNKAESTSTPQQHIHCGDCIAVIGSLPAESIDVVVTSPPYNIGKDYGTHNDNMPYRSYLDWMGQVAETIRRVLKPDGSLFLNIGSPPTKPWLATDVSQQFDGIFQLQNDIIWLKSVSIGEESYGHYTPVSSRRFLNNLHERIFHFTKTRNVELDRLAIGVPYADKANITRFNRSSDCRCRGNAWVIPYETVCSKEEKFHHPASFPVELPKMCIKLHGLKKKPVVLDPFLGVGSTLVACENLGVKGIGIDIDPTYCRTALSRLSNAVLIDKRHGVELEEHP